MQAIVLNSLSLDYSELQNVLPKDVKADFFPKATEKSMILSYILDSVLENLDVRSCPKFQELLQSDKEMWICSSYPCEHKTTLHCAEEKTKKISDRTMQRLKL